MSKRNRTPAPPEPQPKHREVPESPLYAWLSFVLVMLLVVVIPHLFEWGLTKLFIICCLLVAPIAAWLLWYQEICILVAVALHKINSIKKK